jgi:hypothetical protein
MRTVVEQIRTAKLNVVDVMEVIEGCDEYVELLSLLMDLPRTDVCNASFTHMGSNIEEVLSLLCTAVKQLVFWIFDFIQLDANLKKRGSGANILLIILEYNGRCFKDLWSVLISFFLYEKI